MNNCVYSIIVCFCYFYEDYYMSLEDIKFIGFCALLMLPHTIIGTIIIRICEYDLYARYDKNNSKSDNKNNDS